MHAFLLTNYSGAIYCWIFIFYRHNDLPFNLRTELNNNVTAFNFEQDLTNDPLWGRQNCRSCFTDLPRLRKGKVGAQVCNILLSSLISIDNIVSWFKFWAAYVDCKQTQYKDAVAETLEQIDVIRKLVKKYPNDLEFVTTADGMYAYYLFHNHVKINQRYI